MVQFEKFILDNGLKVIVHEDNSSPLVAVNILYHVGARDEHPPKTGFAHLFEHLMFGGSIHIPDYDKPLQNAGGENNAFTNNDITNYYLTLPSENIETGLWLESDRMLSLDFSQHNLDVQRNVVIEEYKQRYLNLPYGDVWLLLRPMAYKIHPYRWPTIGQDISHIENAQLEDVKSFFFHNYAPNNAILVLSGNISPKRAEKLTRKWFAGIKSREIAVRNLPQEPIQEVERKETVYRDVPYDAIYMAFHIGERNHPDFYATDLVSDILANGKSSRLYQGLVQKKRLFSELNAYLTGDLDPGLFVVAGKLIEGVPMESAEKEINHELDKIVHHPVSSRELEKIKNKIESTLVFEETNILNKAMSLAFHELTGDAENINREPERYRSVSKEDISRVSGNIFVQENRSTLYYRSNK
jgi:predicted Zn-dependent peptidase